MRSPDLPLVIGPGANRQEAGYRRCSPRPLRSSRRVKAATWIGNRRWDLTFDSGETLALPEDGAARSAWSNSPNSTARRPLFGRGWMRFDMRDPSKLVARKPGASMAQRARSQWIAAPAGTQPIPVGNTGDRHAADAHTGAEG